MRRRALAQRTLVGEQRILAKRIKPALKELNALMNRYRKSAELAATEAAK